MTKEAPQAELMPAVREDNLPAETPTPMSPLDMPVEVFKEVLERRGTNRKALMAWVRGNLVDGVDFGQIHVIKKDVCSRGKWCENERHFSKPSLWKPGAEKICGMLSVFPMLPSLKEYEQAALSGVEIKQIILRCEIVDGSGRIVANGVGARSLAQDYGDLNKALKMASKSCHIDATLRLAGLSEVFTQDIEDMNLGEAKGGGQGTTGGTATTPPEKAKSTPTSSEKWWKATPNLKAELGKSLYPMTVTAEWTLAVTDQWRKDGLSEAQIKAAARDENNLPVFCPECKGPCWPRHEDSKPTAPEFKCKGLKGKDSACKEGLWWPGRDGNLGQWYSRKDGGWPYRIPAKEEVEG